MAIVTASAAPTSHLPNPSTDAISSTGAAAPISKVLSGAPVDFLALVMLALPAHVSIVLPEGKDVEPVSPAWDGNTRTGKVEIVAALAGATFLPTSMPNREMPGRAREAALYKAVEPKGTLATGLERQLKSPLIVAAPIESTKIAATIVAPSVPRQVIYADGEPHPTLKFHEHAPAALQQQPKLPTIPTVTQLAAAANKGEFEDPPQLPIAATAHAEDRLVAAPQARPLMESLFAAKAGTMMIVRSSGPEPSESAEFESLILSPPHPSARPAITSLPITGNSPPLPANEPAKTPPSPATQVLSLISAHMDQARRHGQVDLQFDLHPAELGHVQLRLTMEDNRVHVRMIVQDEAAKRVLELQLGTLRNRVEEMGVGVGRFDIRRDSSTPDQQRQPPSESSAEPAQTDRATPLHGQRSFVRVARKSGLVDVIA